MARFKGSVEAGRNLAVPVILGALLIILLVFVLWYLINPAAVTAYFNSLSAPYR